MSAPKFKNIPSPNDKGAVYGRFIPREELNSFAAWQPGSLDRRAPPPAAAAEPAAPNRPSGPSEAEMATAIRAARQSGYQDGYRDGLAALEVFKSSFATQMTGQIGALIESHDAQLGAVQHEMARALTACATSLARQMVRSELVQRPQQVAEVARQAVEALLLSARHVSVHVHPDDLPLVAQGAAEVLAARGARLLEDATLTRGGCRVESDIGGVDATIETRWQHSAAAIGNESEWAVDAEASE